jgi:hypothetical protein
MSASAFSKSDSSLPEPPDSLRPDEESLAGYAAISRPAVAALVLGLAAPLILISPLLIFVPLGALAVAILALRQIAASGGQLKGAWPATIGLCLATLFLGWGVTGQLSRQANLAGRAERFADGWLKLVHEGRLQEADQLMRAGSDRIRNPEARAEHYRIDIEASSSLQGRFGAEPLKSFRAIGPQGTWHLAGIASQSRSVDNDVIVLKYQYDRGDGSGPRPMWITVVRTAEQSTRPPEWQIRHAEAFLPQGI